MTTVRSQIKKTKIGHGRGAQLKFTRQKKKREKKIPPRPRFCSGLQGGIVHDLSAAGGLTAEWSARSRITEWSVQSQSSGKPLAWRKRGDREDLKRHRSRSRSRIVIPLARVLWHSMRTLPRSRYFLALSANARVGGLFLRSRVRRVFTNHLLHSKGCPLQLLVVMVGCNCWL